MRFNLISTCLEFRKEFIFFKIVEFFVGEMATKIHVLIYDHDLNRTFRYGLYSNDGILQHFA